MLSIDSLLTVPRRRLPLKKVSIETTGWIKGKANTMVKVSTQTNTGMINL